MKELNSQCKIIEETNVNGRLILKVKDSVYYKIVFMELYAELKPDDSDTSNKLENEIRELKEQGVISDYFINDDFSSGVKYFYKIYDEFDFDSSLDKNSDKVVENIAQKEVGEYTPIDSSHINQNKINKKKIGKVVTIVFLIIAGIVGNNIYKKLRGTQTMEKIKHKFSIKSDYDKGINYFKKRQYYKAEHYLKTSCNLDKNKKACYKLAVIYEQRKVLKTNANNLALKFYKKSCKFGYKNACKKGDLKLEK